MALLVPLRVVTNTLAVPALPLGGAAVRIEVELTTTTGVAAVPPMETAVAPVKPVPVILINCPPASGPDEGLRDSTVGTP